ncbi:LysR family transcriptional regulator [Oscillatoriales cyanobacterium LEGE 11467]|uniref:LysR family transcriptional regulator n=1 Tax=Zarconia navalis LEGE 11467 TaxID=1828826 RepID=A0A928Z7S7_9CYAN|nr:LysR family transcriptional regulator [Zarconia navalis]MBE9041737.1 LysR family transcriptional regulator [Zarconia navalis LEGE 11467]
MLHATLHQLKVFETVARHSSFTRAAAELSISQPTVSSQVKQLTKAIGLPLFEQIGKQLYLTDVGRELLVTSQGVFEKLDNFEMKVADFKGAKEGKLRLAVVTTAKYFVPQLLGAFCQQYPAIDISLQVTNHQKLKRRMLENEDDLYILSQPPEDLDLHLQAFLDNPLVVVARSDCELARKKNMPIEYLDREKFIMREPGSGTRQAIEKLFSKHKISIEVRLELGSNEAIKQAILGGLGISILSQHTLRYELERGELAILDVQKFPIQRHWYVAYLGGKQLSVVAQMFLQHLLAKSPEYVECLNLKIPVPQR